MNEYVLDSEREEIARQIQIGYTSGHLNDGEGNSLYWEIKINILERAPEEVDLLNLGYTEIRESITNK